MVLAITVFIGTDQNSKQWILMTDKRPSDCSGKKEGMQVGRVGAVKIGKDKKENQRRLG